MFGVPVLPLPLQLRCFKSVEMIFEWQPTVYRRSCWRGRVLKGRYRSDARTHSTVPYHRWMHSYIVIDSWHFHLDVIKNNLRRGISKNPFLYISNMHFSVPHAYICRISKVVRASRTVRYCVGSLFNGKESLIRNAWKHFNFHFHFHVSFHFETVSRE